MLNILKSVMSDCALVRHFILLDHTSEEVSHRRARQLRAIIATDLLDLQKLQGKSEMPVPLINGLQIHMGRLLDELNRF